MDKCGVCIKHRMVKHQPMEISELPTYPWEVVGSDVFTFQDHLYLVLVDYYSKWIEAVAIESQTSNSVIVAMKKLFSCFGIPKVIRSDNGRCYDSREFRNFAESFGFTLVTSSPRYPESNGQAESAVKVVKSLWNKSADKNAALSVYRNTPLATGYTPSELMFGRPLRSNLGIPRKCEVDYKAFERSEQERRVGQLLRLRKEPTSLLSLLFYSLQILSVQQREEQVQLSIYDSPFFGVGGELSLSSHANSTIAAVLWGILGGFGSE